MSLAGIVCRTAQHQFNQQLRPNQYNASTHTDGDISSELKNAAKALAADFARADADVLFSSEGIKTIDPKDYGTEYMTNRIKNHWQHVLMERGQVMSEAVTALDGCDCSYCALGTP